MLAWYHIHYTLPTLQSRMTEEIRRFIWSKDE